MRTLVETAVIDEVIAQRYPRNIFTRDGTSLTLTPMVASEWLWLGDQLDLHKLTDEWPADQTGLITFLRRMGFKTEACLTDFIRDREGRLHDMMVMVLDVDQFMSMHKREGEYDEPPTVSQ